LLQSDIISALPNEVQNFINIKVTVIRRRTDGQLATDDLEELVASICRIVQDDIPEVGGGKLLPNVGTY
jgi:hypothetical protein